MIIIRDKYYSSYKDKPSRDDKKNRGSLAKDVAITTGLGTVGTLGGILYKGSKRYEEMAKEVLSKREDIIDRAWNAKLNNPQLPFDPVEIAENNLKQVEKAEKSYRKMKNIGKLALGLGAAGLGYGAYKLYKSQKDKKKRIDENKA